MEDIEAVLEREELISTFGLAGRYGREYGVLFLDVQFKADRAWSCGCNFELLEAHHVSNRQRWKPLQF